MDVSECQIVVPQSFVELFAVRGRPPGSSRALEVLQRYEVCEDLAQLLGEQGRDRLLGLGLHAVDVRASMAAVLDGLQASGTLSAAERGWVLTRAEEVGRWQQA